MRVAAVQMNSQPEKAPNLEFAEKMVTQAKKEGARLVAFPENAVILTEGHNNILAAAEPPDGPSVQKFQCWAKSNELWIHLGSLPITSDSDHVANSSLMIAPDGNIAARYDKMHLFDVEMTGDKAYRESRTVTPGRGTVTVKVDNHVAGLSVCYDLRFPELYRELSREGAEILFIPSAFTAITGEAHWDTLTRARAIENQCFVIAPGQTGTHINERKTWGHTRIIDPWGRVLAEQAVGPGLVFAELDFEELARIRSEIPCLNHRRISLNLSRS